METEEKNKKYNAQTMADAVNETTAKEQLHNYVKEPKDIVLNNLVKQQTNNLLPKDDNDGRIVTPEEYKATPAMQQIIDAYNNKANNLPIKSDDELAKLRKRQRTRNIISAIADGVSAISNLVFTSKYAPNMYDPSKSMTAAQKERWDRFMADQDRLKDEQFNLRLQALGMGDKARQEDYNQWLQEQILNMKDAGNDGINWRNNINNSIAEEKLRGAKAGADIKEAEANNAEEYYKNRARRAGQVMSRGRSGGSGTSKNNRIHIDVYGERLWLDKGEQYKQDVITLAEEWNAFNPEDPIDLEKMKMSGSEDEAVTKIAGLLQDKTRGYIKNADGSISKREKKQKTTGLKL